MTQLTHLHGDVDRDHGLHLLADLIRIRRFEERCVELDNATTDPRLLHLCTGEERRHGRGDEGR